MTKFNVNHNIQSKTTPELEQIKNYLQQLKDSGAAKLEEERYLEGVKAELKGREEYEAKKKQELENRGKIDGE